MVYILYASRHRFAIISFEISLISDRFVEISTNNQNILAVVYDF